MSVYLSIAGLAVLLYRLRPWLTAPRLTSESSWTPLVSIIIPCRNEASNLPALLTSLVELDYPALEIIVIDDASTDRTAEIAHEFVRLHANITVVTAPEKPPGWVGKNWACWIGAGRAKGELFLFTDADTIHLKDSLQKVTAAFRGHRAEMLSAPPFHLCCQWWERLLGAFQLFPLIVTGYRQPPTFEKLYAIGQYLLFTSQSYRALSGHAAIAGSLAEDIDLARLWRGHGCHYVVYPFADLYSVQMFNTFKNFCAGWRRLLRVGLVRSHIGSIFEIAVVMNLLTAGFGQGAYGLFFIGAAVIFWTQRSNGRFSWLGAILAPFSCFLFIALTLAALTDRLTGRQIYWRGRAYPL